MHVLPITRKVSAHCDRVLNEVGKAYRGRIESHEQVEGAVKSPAPLVTHRSRTCNRFVLLLQACLSVRSISIEDDRLPAYFQVQLSLCINIINLYLELVKLKSCKTCNTDAAS
eukprot:1640278-Amphidinium_carterae.1